MKKFCISYSLILFLSVSIFFKCQHEKRPQLVVKKENYLVSDEINISVTGLLPNQTFQTLLQKEERLG